MKFLVIFVLAVSLALNALGSDPSEIESVVRSFAPVTEENDPGVDGIAADEFAWIVAPFGRNAEPPTEYIIAAYSNGETQVRLLARTESKWRLVEEWHVSGNSTFPSVTLRNLMGDSTPEVIVRSEVGLRADSVNGYHWIFSWSGTTLIERQDEENPLFSIADYVDVDGDGEIELIGYFTKDAYSEEESALGYAPDYKLYEWTTDGDLVLAGDIPLHEIFSIKKKRDNVKVIEFEAENTEKRYNLRILREGTRANWHAKGGEIRLNGVVVATERDLKEKDIVIKPVFLRAKNVLEIRIPDAPSGEGVPPEKDSDLALRILIDNAPASN